MSVRTQFPAGAGYVALIDNTDNPDPASRTVDIHIGIPNAGINLHSNYSFYIDEVWQGTSGLDLVYGSAGYQREISYESFYIPEGAVHARLDWPDTGSSGLGGAQSMSIDLVQQYAPFVWVNVGGIWKRAIPFVFSENPAFPGSGSWKKGTPYIWDSSEWKPLA